MLTLSIILTLLYAIIPSVFFIINHSYYYVLIFTLSAPLAFYIFGFIITSFYLLIIAITKEKKLKLQYTLFKNIVNFYRKTIYFLKIKAYNVPKTIDFEKLVLVGNHKAKLDPIFLISVFKFPISFTPKESLYRSSLLRFIFKKLKAVKIYRKDLRKTIDSLNEATNNIINKNIRYVIFPEGGTHNNQTEKIIDSKPAAYKIVLKSKANLLPFSIKHNLNFKIHKTKKIEVYFHDIINYDDIKELTTLELSKKMETIINKSLD